MKRLLLMSFAVIAAAPSALAVPPARDAGCWATVKLSSMPTSTTRIWNVRVTPLQHGRTLLANARPRVEIRQGSSAWRAFRARPTQVSGTYHARVVFPAPGTWRFRVWDGFEPHCARFHTYAPIKLTWKLR